MRIAVCEDETLFRAQIVTEIEKYYHSLDVIVDGFSSGEELIEKYEQGKQEGQLPHYDILFLDIVPMEEKKFLFFLQAIQRWQCRDMR